MQTLLPRKATSVLEERAETASLAARVPCPLPPKGSKAGQESLPRATIMLMAGPRRSPVKDKLVLVVQGHSLNGCSG